MSMENKESLPLEPTMIVATHFETLAKLGWSTNSSVFSAKINVPESSEPLLVKIKQYDPAKYFKSRALVFSNAKKSEREVLESIPRDQVQKIREVFLESGSRLVKLQHENLTSVLGVYLPDDSVYYGVVMEHFKGETLGKLLKTEEGREILSKIPLKTRLLWIRQIADALQFLHQNGLVHHNLHHSNLIIDLKTMTVKITDFFAEWFMKPAGMDGDETKNKQEEDEEEEEDNEDEENEEDAEEDEGEDEEEITEEEKARRLEKQRMIKLSKLAEFESPPEMLAGLDFNKASDVYCFTMLLWQILCCEIPFADFKDKQGLQTQMVNENLRPSLEKITASLPKNDASEVFLRNIGQGWTLFPTQRTSLAAYIQSIDALLQKL